MPGLLCLAILPPGALSIGAHGSQPHQHQPAQPAGASPSGAVQVALGPPHLLGSFRGLRELSCRSATLSWPAVQALAGLPRLQTLRVASLELPGSCAYDLRTAAWRQLDVQQLGFPTDALLLASVPGLVAMDVAEVVWHVWCSDCLYHHQRSEGTPAVRDPPAIPLEGSNEASLSGEGSADVGRTGRGTPGATGTASGCSCVSCVHLAGQAERAAAAAEWLGPLLEAGCRAADASATAHGLHAGSCSGGRAGLVRPEAEGGWHGGLNLQLLCERSAASLQTSMAASGSGSLLHHEQLSPAYGSRPAPSHCVAVLLAAVAYDLGWRVRSVTLQGAGVGAEAAQQLAGEAWSGVATLQLQHGFLADSAAEGLLCMVSGGRLRTLHLACEAGEEAVRQLRNGAPAGKGKLRLELSGAHFSWVQVSSGGSAQRGFLPRVAPGKK